MSTHVVITVKNEGSPAEHVNSRILEQFKLDVANDFSGNGTIAGSNTSITVEYVKGEPIEGQIEGGPADFSAEPAAAEAVKADAEVEDPDRDVRSRRDEQAKRRKDKAAEDKAEEEAEEEAEVVEPAPKAVVEPEDRPDLGQAW